MCRNGNIHKSKVFIIGTVSRFLEGDWVFIAFCLSWDNTAFFGNIHS